MIFKPTGAFAALLAFLCLSAGGAETGNAISVGGSTLARPLILRSDFTSERVIQRLFVRSTMQTPESAASFVGRHPALCKKFFHKSYIEECQKYLNGELSSPPMPILKNGKIRAVGPGFDWHGGSRFQNVVVEKHIHFWENDFAKNYQRAMDKWLAKEIAKDPEKYRGVFSDETIKLYAESAKTGKSVPDRKLLKLANGDDFEFHHDVASKKILVLSQTEHRGQETLPSMGHGSGTKLAGGGNATWGKRTPFGEVVKVSSVRWGGMAGSDLIASSLALAMGGVKDKDRYIANAGSVGAAFLAATMSESLMVAAFPLSAGTTPIWLGILGVSSGGPAAWVATGVYFGARAAVMYGWNEYQLAQARRIEDACREAERATRVWLLTQSLAQNMQILESIVSGATP